MPTQHGRPVTSQLRWEAEAFELRSSRQIGHVRISSTCHTSGGERLGSGSTQVLREGRERGREGGSINQWPIETGISLAHVGEVPHTARVSLTLNTKSANLGCKKKRNKKQLSLTPKSTSRYQYHQLTGQSSAPSCCTQPELSLLTQHPDELLSTCRSFSIPA